MHNFTDLEQWPNIMVIYWCIATPSIHQYYSIHHKNTDRWLNKDLDKVRVIKRSKRKNKIGRGSKKVNIPKLKTRSYCSRSWIRENSKLCLFQSRPILVKTISKITSIQPEFKASEGWVDSFLQRYNLVLRQTTSIGTRATSKP